MFNPLMIVYFILLLIISCTFQYMDKNINNCVLPWSYYEDRKCLICMFYLSGVMNTSCSAHFLPTCQFYVISLKPQAAFDDLVSKCADSWEAHHTSGRRLCQPLICWWLPVKQFQHSLPEASHPPISSSTGFVQQGVASHSFQLGLSQTSLQVNQVAACLSVCVWEQQQRFPIGKTMSCI